MVSLDLSLSKTCGDDSTNDKLRAANIQEVIDKDRHEHHVQSWS
jgi:hypothetical protein